MREQEAIHTAARRFCLQQGDLWVSCYTEMQPEGKDTVRTNDQFGWAYSDAALNAFPRYRFYHRLLPKIEAINVEQFTTASLRSEFLQVARAALDELSKEFRNTRIALEALRNEAECFSRFLQEDFASVSLGTEPLPKRRTLTNQESHDLWMLLGERWGVRRGFPWFPLEDVPQLISSALAFHQELWEFRDGNVLLMKALRQHAVEYCRVLLELDLDISDHEIEVAELDPYYNGAEKFITSDGSWLVYASHESSITVAGWLRAEFLDAWPDAERLAYGGPFHTEDLRGTWG